MGIRVFIVLSMGGYFYFMFVLVETKVRALNLTAFGKAAYPPYGGASSGERMVDFRHDKDQSTQPA
jgi:hypothetical protein